MLYYPEFKNRTEPFAYIKDIYKLTTSIYYKIFLITK